MRSSRCVVLALRGLTRFLRAGFGVHPFRDEFSAAGARGPRLVRPPAPSPGPPSEFSARRPVRSVSCQNGLSGFSFLLLSSPPSALDLKCGGAGVSSL